MQHFSTSFFCFLRVFNIDICQKQGSFGILRGQDILQGNYSTEEKSTTAVSLGTETLLLIEDDDIVRTVTKAMIEGIGYNVIEVGDG